jgi:hypothetical protein
VTAVAYTRRIAEQAERLTAIVADLPWSLTPRRGEPLIEVLIRVDAAPGGGAAVTGRLLEIAVEIHPADPMAWASKFLRHLPELRANQQTALDARNSACAGARYAKPVAIESTYDPTVGIDRDAVQWATTLLSPELLDAVLSYAECVNGEPLPYAASATLTEAACVALTMLDRHATSANRTHDSLRMMQAHVGGRSESRLGWQLGQVMPGGVARSAARLLVGWGGVQERGLLWHVAHRTNPDSIPTTTLTKWHRDFADLDPAVHADPRGRSRTRDRVGRHAATARLASPISTPDREAIEQLALPL